MKIRALSFSPCVIFKTAERKKNQRGKLCAQSEAERTDSGFSCRATRLWEQPEILLLSTAISTCWFSHSSSSSSVLRVLHTAEINTPALKMTHTHTERIKTLVINVHFAFYCSFSSKLHIFFLNVLILNKNDLHLILNLQNLKTCIPVGDISIHIIYSLNW